MAARCATEAFSTTCAVHIEDSEGWWLSGCRGSVAEHWWLKPEASWVRLSATAGLFYFHRITSDKQISGLILIFTECGMCQVFAQQVTIMVIKFHSISSQKQRNVKFICITVQDELISSLCSLIGSKFQVTSSYVMWN